jgi:hypothetical protein
MARLEAADGKDALQTWTEARLTYRSICIKAECDFQLFELVCLKWKSVKCGILNM